MTTGFQALLALCVLLTAIGLAAALTLRAPRAVLLALAVVVGASAVAAWIAYAVRLEHELALSAAGLTATLLAATAALPLRGALDRARRMDEHLAAGEQRLREVVEREVAERRAELEQLLARSRAESLSLLADEERRLAEERRRALSERERDAGDELAEAFASVQRRVESRLAGWAEDLERGEQRFAAQLARLDERQGELIGQAEARISADVERLEAGTEQQRAGLVRLREELGRAAEQVVEQSSVELEEHAAERRRALHELGDRLRRRERELLERIDREESEARQRVVGGFSDLERRVLDQLERATELAVGRYSEASGQEFAATIKTAREDAARRLARELDRAVESFSRQASNVLAERLAEVGDAGARRVEQRLSEVASVIDRQRDELLAGLEERLAALEHDFRRRIEVIASDAEAERSVLDGRLRELAQRLDEAVEHARGRLSPVEERPLG